MPQSNLYTLHALEVGDVPDVIRIGEECRLSPWSKKDYREEAIRSDSTMVRLENDSGEIVGFIVGRRIPGSGIESLQDAELYNIGVKPRHQGNGCGTLLLNTFLDDCKSNLVSNIWLDVRASNSQAIKFYRKFGFIEFLKRKGFYTHPDEDGIVMKLLL